MTPEQIADHLVEMEIVKCLHSKFPPSGYVYTIPYSAEAECSAGELITDWRVAGKCLESIRGESCEQWFKFCKNVLPHTFHDMSLPQAICTAYCEATHD